MSSLQFHLLQGLAHNSASTATMIVEEAVRSEEAAVTMQRAVRRFLLLLQQNKQPEEERPRKRAKTGRSKAPRRKKPTVKSKVATATTTPSTTTAMTQHTPQQQQPHWLWRSLRAYAAQERAVAVQLLLQSPRRWTRDACSRTRCAFWNTCWCCRHKQQLPASAAAVEQVCAVVQHLLLLGGRNNGVSADATAHVYRYWPWWCRQLYRCSCSSESRQQSH